MSGETNQVKTKLPAPFYSQIIYLIIQPSVNVDFNLFKLLVSKKTFSNSVIIQGEEGKATPVMWTGQF